MASLIIKGTARSEMAARRERATHRRERGPANEVTPLPRLPIDSGVTAALAWWSLVAGGLVLLGVIGHHDLTGDRGTDASSATAPDADPLAETDV
ncbi:hypothetical protein [Streptomyces sp. NPDC002602]|uniref:hypothetical protein n=1 Tax=Streptomyces sp. NPDC002602 TaxID=3364654 RepID=UPI00367580B6